MRRIGFGLLLATMLVNEPTFGAAAAEHHGMLSLQTGELLLVLRLCGKQKQCFGREIWPAA